MDTRVAKKKLGLKDRYAAMTRGLGWQTTYQPMERVFPYDKFEGIKIHDWDKWEDPFRLTMDAYWKYQGEKEKKLYAVIDAFAQNNGQLGISDARYVNALKLFMRKVRKHLGGEKGPRLSAPPPRSAPCRSARRCSRRFSTIHRRSLSL